MASLPEREEQHLKELVRSLRCRMCRRSLEGERVQLTAQQEHVCIFSVRCCRCRHRQRYWISLEDLCRELSVLEPNADEQQRFAALTPVSADDLLDLHVFLEQFDGDFKSLFRALRGMNRGRAS